MYASVCNGWVYRTEGGVASIMGVCVMQTIFLLAIRVLGIGRMDSM